MLLKLFNAVISSKSGSGRRSGHAIRVLKSLGKAHHLEPVFYPSLEECSGTVSVTDTARTSPKGLTASRIGPPTRVHALGPGTKVGTHG